MSNPNSLHASKSGLPCFATSFDKVLHACFSHLEHVERGLPHVCCCDFEWELSPAEPLATPLNK